MDIRATTLRAGELHHRLTLHAPEGRYAAGSPQTIATGIRARITALTIQQRERIGLGGLSGQTVYIITIRYRQDLDTDFELHEVSCTHRVFRIVAMIPTDRREGWEITAVEGNR